MNAAVYEICILEILQCTVYIGTGLLVSAVVYGHRDTGFSTYYTDTTYRGMGGGGGTLGTKF